MKIHDEGGMKLTRYASLRVNDISNDIVDTVISFDIIYAISTSIAVSYLREIALRSTIQDHVLLRRIACTDGIPCAVMPNPMRFCGLQINVSRACRADWIAVAHTTNPVM